MVTNSDTGRVELPGGPEVPFLPRIGFRTSDCVADSPKGNSFDGEFYSVRLFLVCTEMFRKITMIVRIPCQLDTV